MKLLIWEDGRPRIAASEERWLKAVREDPETAWKMMLHELREGGIGPEQADMIEGALAYIAMRAGLPYPSIGLRDTWFVEEYGPSAAKITAEKQAEADRDVREFMRETGIANEAEARKALVEEMLQAMQIISEGLKSGEIQAYANAIALIEKGGMK